MKTAIFLTGGPGSGKDLLIKKVFENFGFKEYNIDQLKPKKFYTENMVIVANSYDLEKIMNAKSLLENCYYKPSMLYVFVEEDVSKERLLNRIYDENSRAEKMRISEENLEVFGKEFNNFFIFDNSFISDSDQIIEQLDWINEEIENLTENPVDKFKKKINKSKKQVTYDPNLVKPDGIYQTYDTRAAGNGDLVRNYEAMEPGPLVSEPIGFGSNMGNFVKQEPMQTLKDKPAEKVFKRVKKIIFGKNKK